MAFRADDSRARGDDELVPGHRDGAAQRREDLVRESGEGVGGVGQPAAYDDELVADDPRDGVCRWQGDGQVAGQGDEQGVAGVEAEGVVDPLHVVEVQVDQRDVVPVG